MQEFDALQSLLRDFRLVRRAHRQQCTRRGQERFSSRGVCVAVHLSSTGRIAKWRLERAVQRWDRIVHLSTVDLGKSTSGNIDIATQIELRNSQATEG